LNKANDQKGGLPMTRAEELPIQSYLGERHIRFEVVPHERTETALAEAQALDLPAADILKVLILRSGDDYAMAIIPGSRRLDMSLVKKATADPHVRLATEDEIRAHFPEFELGALPALPGLLGVKAYVDPRVLDHAEAAFADGRQTESMHANPRELLWGEDALVASISQPERWRLEGDAVDVAS
jgi:Ala-tRNA(Pro) deacylase